MGALLSIPLLAGGLGSIGSSLFSGCMLFMGGTAASAFCKSCNCNSSIATRVGFGLIFALSSMLAYISRTDLAIKQIEKLSWDWIKMDCSGGRCYGLLAVHRFCFALVLFHSILALSLIGVTSTKTKRAALQNGWWGPKILLYGVLAFVAFLIPNEFFMFYGNYISTIGAFFFILIGLVLLVDFAHTWSETCLDNWERSESNVWQLVLVGSTFGMYIGTVALTILLYVFFAGSGCGLNTFFITANLVLAAAVTVLAISPPVQEVNPKSGLAQASMVAAYCTYLTASAVANHNDGAGHGQCNPLHRDGTKTTTVVLGALFTFLAIAYSTSRAATQSKALVGRKQAQGGAIALPTDDDAADSGDHLLITSQPKRRDPMRYEAMKAAVEAGSLPASVLDEPESEDEDEARQGEDRDDERTGTKYNYSWFHAIFIMAAMYVGGLLTDWRIVSNSPVAAGIADATPAEDVFIGRSEAAMWMRVISSWLCFGIYTWSLVAPLVLPDRFGSE